MTDHHHSAALAPYGILFDSPSPATVEEPSTEAPLLGLTERERDLIAARWRREGRTIEAARAHAAWKRQARDIVLAIAARRPVSGNEVWELLDLPPDGNGRRLSEVFRGLVKEGLIHPIGWTKPEAGHGSTIRIYERTRA